MGPIESVVYAAVRSGARHVAREPTRGSEVPAGPFPLHSAALPQPSPRCTGLVSIGPAQPVQRKTPTHMSTLFIGVRHLHIPVLSVLPILHGFLLLEDGAVLKSFSGDRGRGRLRARLDVYEADYSTEHPDSRGIVALRAAGLNWTRAPQPHRSARH